MSGMPLAYSIATRIREAHVAELMGDVDGRRVLDCGCGLGYFSDLLARRGACVWGVDPDTSSMGFWRKGARRCRFVVGESERLPFRNGAFDAILCSEVIEHVRDDSRAIAEMARVGRPGAAVVITVPCLDGLFAARIKRIAHDHSGTFEEHHRDGYTFPDLEGKLASGGITVVEKRYSMIFLSELVMGLCKLAYSSGGRKLTRQADILPVADSFLFKLWRFVFPCVMALCRLEDVLLSRRAKGHMLIVKGVVNEAAAGS